MAMNYRNQSYLRNSSLMVLMLVSSTLFAGEWSGYLQGEVRGYLDQPLYAGQKNRPSFSLQLEPEYYHEWDEGARSFEFTPYLRWDSYDDERSIFDLRELFVQVVEEHWEARVGISKVFWGVTESQHLVDVVNQTDMVASFDGEEKLGQPMIQWVQITPWGDLELFLLPGFRERTFPGVEGRLRSGLWVNTDEARYESSAEASHLDVAIRWTQIMGDFDLGLHYFRGTNREPVLIPELSGSDPYLIPYYEQMDQVGLDLQFTHEGWLLKLETIWRNSRSDEYVALVGGVEYTFYGIWGSSLDVGVLMEGHYDSRGDFATNPFNRDVFTGTRLAWNDEADTSMVAGVFYDLENETLGGRIEFERRIGASLKLEIEVQLFGKTDRTDLLYGLRRDSYAQVGLSRYF